EEKFSQIYDELVESRFNKNTFAEEARLVASFIQLYIQCLFDLKEPEFKNIIKTNRELHLRADQCQRRGRNPLFLLEKQIKKQDTLGRILKKYSTHLGALDCILDVRASAALVHHMISMDPSEILPERIVGCEFGAGFGILSFAGSIPFVGMEKNLSVIGFEQEQQSCDDAEKIAQILATKSKYSDRVTFSFQKGDITTSAPFEKVRCLVREKGPLSLWISETFGYQSKKPVVFEAENACRFENPTGVSPYSEELEKIYDPLPIVIEHSCNMFDSFIPKIKNKSIVAFPDFVTPQVVIDGKNSSLLSPDGIWRNLNEIGQPYDMLPKCEPTRWRLIQTEAPYDKRLRTNAKSKNKKQ
ncbi:MAG: hypothetical protein ACWGOX_04145, partial [Desulforhopalus sp.]